MEELAQKHCVSCEGFSARYSPAEAQEKLSLITGWEMGENSLSISRKFSFKGFLSVMNFVNAVAYIAQREGHHPDISLGFNYCHITFSTHAIHGLSENDFICAAKVNGLLL